MLCNNGDGCCLQCVNRQNVLIIKYFISDLYEGDQLIKSASIIISNNCYPSRFIKRSTLLTHIKLALIFSKFVENHYRRVSRNKIVFSCSNESDIEKSQKISDLFASKQKQRNLYQIHHVVISFMKGCFCIRKLAYFLPLLECAKKKHLFNRAEKRRVDQMIQNHRLFQRWTTDSF